MKALAAVIASLLLASCASSTNPGAVGVTRQQTLWLPSAQVEKQASDAFLQMAVEAKGRGKLITSGPEHDRIKGIFLRLQSQVGAFRPDAANWHWQLALIDSPELNAACAPGGKIIYFTGLSRTLALTDDEIAIIGGHEIAHALREHGREKASQAAVKNTVMQIASIAAPSASGLIGVTNTASQLLLTLPNSRQNEVEADQIGLELAARAGFNPNASISVWQKMNKASQGRSTPLQFMSTHPSNDDRIADLTRLIPTVMPFYETSRRRR